MSHSSSVFFVFALFSVFILRGQSSAQFPNLVVNPSFEQRAVPFPGNTQTTIDTIHEFFGWSSPTMELAEVYGLDKDGWIEDPTNIRGQRNFKAKTGQQVAQIVTYRRSGSRNYIQGELSDSLTIGQKYYIGFWTHFHCLATNNICMAFSTESIHIDSIIRLQMTPKARLREVNNYDKKNIWLLTVDSFVADQVYKYCIIGNFFRNDSTGLGGSIDFGHYIGFVDDVFVIKAKSSAMPPTSSTTT